MPLPRLLALVALVILRCHVKVQVCGAVVTTPPVMTTTGHAPAVVFLVTAGAVSDVAELNVVFCGTPLTWMTLCLVKFVPVAERRRADTGHRTAGRDRGERRIGRRTGSTRGHGSALRCSCPAPTPAQSVPPAASPAMSPPPQCPPPHAARSMTPAPRGPTFGFGGVTPLAAPGYDPSVPPAVAPEPDASADVLVAKVVSVPWVPSSK